MEPINYDVELFVPGKIRTFTGKYFDAFNPDPNLIDIRDIAHALSMIPRFAGHLPKFYSVAQHSLHVMHIAPPRVKLRALLHDATEAYLTDIPSPFKQRLPDYREAEAKLNTCILNKFGIFEGGKMDVKACDIKALKAEWDVLMMQRTKEFTNPTTPISTLDISKTIVYNMCGMDHEQAERQFLIHFYKLYDALHMS